MDQNKEYYAFISYKREDERWAKWLQNKLEHFKLPSNLNGRTDLPREIRPIFRDTSELTPGNLPQQIHDALDKSRFLIVVCSPHSAQSKWVNLEIETFIAMGKQDCIIPFIIEGHPYDSDPAVECFPQAIRSLPNDKELLGANITEMGRDAAVVKTVAKMFGIRFDALWKRHEREQKRKRTLIITAVSLFILAVMGVAAYIFHQNTLISKKQAELLQAYNDLTLANQETEQERLRAENERDRANQEKNNAENERDRANQERIRAELAEDSIRIQYGIIEKTYTELRQTTQAKSQAQSRAAAEVALKLIEEGDAYLARKVAMEALNVSYTVEAESALRKASQSTSAIFRGHDKDLGVSMASFSPDCKYVVSTSEDKNIVVWDVATGKSDTFTTVDGWGLKDVRFSPDGKYLASFSWDNNVQIWDFATGECLYHEHTYDGETSVGFTTDGKCIVSEPKKGHYFVTDLSRPNDYTIPGTGLGLFEPSSFTSVSPEGKRLVSVSDEAISIINIETNEIITTIKKDRFIDSVDKASFSPDGKLLLTIEGDYVLQIWDIDSKQCIQTLRGDIETASFSPDGKHIATAPGKERNVISIWDVKSGQEIQTIPVSMSAYNRISTVQYSSDGKYLTTANTDGTVRLLEVNKDVSLNTFHYGECTSVAYSSDGKYLALGTQDGRVIVSNASTGSIINTFDNPLSGFTHFSHISFSPDDTKVLWDNEEESVCIWNTTTGDLLHSFHDKNNAEFSPDSRYLVTGSRESIQIWDVFTWDCVKTIEEDNILDVSFSPDGKRIISSTNKGTINIWDVQTGKLLQNVYTGMRDASLARFSPDEKYVVYCFSVPGSIYIWDTEKRELVHDIDCEMITEMQIQAVFSPDCKRIITTGSNEDIVQVWDVATGKLLQTLKGHTQYIDDISCNIDGRHIVSTCSDGTTKVWDVPPIETLIQETRKQFESNPLSSEERAKCYLQ